MSTFEERRQRRIDRLHNAAQRTQASAESHMATADRMSSVIPFGQPIQVGHYSEGTDRRYRERIHRHMEKGFEELSDAKDYERRAQAAENNTAIFSDDPNAAEKLEDKIARLERRQAMMIAANKLVRKDDRAGLAELGFPDTVISKLFIPDFCGRIGYPDYAIKNNGANIRRLKERLVTVQAHADDETKENTIGDVRIVDNVEENRLQVFFPGKPSDAVRSELKSHGFRWSPYNGCWQRNRSNDAAYWANQIVTKYYSEGES